MWKYALWGGFALLAASSDVNPRNERVNSSLIASPPRSSAAPSFPSPVIITLSDHKPGPSSTSSRPPHFTLAPSHVSPPFTNSTSIAPSSVHTGPCTGCVIQAYNLITTSFEEEDTSNPWTSVVVTETVVTQIITYFDGSTIDTIVTEAETVNQTKTVVINDGDWTETITHATPTFVVEPTPGMYITLLAGPTYLIYDDLGGGLDEYINSTYPALGLAMQTCAPYPTKLKNWEPTSTEDWSYFIQTYTGEPSALPTDWPLPLPSKLVDFLKQDPDIVSQYRGADIATCTTHAPNDIDISTGDPDRTMQPEPTLPPEAPSSPATATESTTLHKSESLTAPVFSSVTTGTFISTTYESTSTHVTRQGCLRCENTKPVDPPKQTDDAASGKMTEATDGTPAPTSNPDGKPKPNEKPEPNNPNQPENKPNPNHPQSAPSIPDIIVSIIHNNPSIWSQQPAATPAGQSITIGDHIYPVHTPEPAQNNPDQPHEQDQAAPAIVIGTETFYPGETKTINGVPVVAPTGGGGSRLVVDGSTMTISPTGGAPVLTIGSSTTITANPAGEFVIGPSTLAPGGPAITVEGSTYSLGPSGTVVVVNGQTSTLANAAPAGIVTAAPALTIDGATYTATVQDGTTAYVLGPGTTLSPGDAVTMAGTTYSLDPKGTALVVNGQTSSIQMVPASNSASTTATSGAQSSASVSARKSTTTSGRDAGDLIASGIGETSKGAGVSNQYGRGGGLDMWVEGVVVGAAGWMLLLL